MVSFSESKLFRLHGKLSFKKLIGDTELWFANLDFDKSTYGPEISQPLEKAKIESLGFELFDVMPNLKLVSSFGRV